MSRHDPKRYQFQGKMLTLSELADMSSWSRTKLWQRIERENMEPAEAVLPLKTDSPLETTYDYNGRRLTRSELARATGIPISTLTYRLNNWTFEEAVKKERRVKPGSRMLKAMTPEGEKEMTMAQWARYRRIELGTIFMRKSRGWTDEQALEYALPPSESEDWINPLSLILKAKTPEGEKEMTVAEWAAYRGIKSGAIKMRKHRKWTNEQALGYARPPSRSRKKDAT